MPLTDGATRLAGDINAGAKKLRASDAPRLEIEHQPLSVPEGVKGAYEVGLNSSLDHPKSGGALFINELNSRRGWGTTYHLNQVRVPRALRINKQEGESVILVLERAPDGQIDVVDIR